MEITDDGTITIDIDWVMANYSRDELLSALGFDQPSDYLDEVTAEDAFEHFGESAMLEHIDISDHWDSNDAYERYGSDLVYDYFSEYSNTGDWSTSDYIEDHGNHTLMLETLLEGYVDVDEVYTAMPESMEEPLVALINPKPKIKHELLSALLRANNQNLRGC